MATGRLRTPSRPNCVQVNTFPGSTRLHAVTLHGSGSMKTVLRNWLFILSLFLVFGLWFWWWGYSMGVPSNDSSEASTSAAVRGQIGDKFGALNTLFTGLAFIGLAYSIMRERQARKGGEQAHARQVELAADTARMQALPILIGLQRDRIGAEFGELCPEWKERYVSLGWARGSLEVLHHRRNEDLAKLAKEQPYGPSSDYLKATFDSLLISEVQERLDRVNRAISAVTILIEYLETYPLLYSKMRVASLSGAPKGNLVSA